MNLFCLGINHRTAPLGARESVWFSNEEIARLQRSLKERNLQECVLVSTCNRTELYGVPAAETHSTEHLVRFLIESKNSHRLAQPSHFHMYRSVFAVRHLLNVASGIDSIILGDVQILGQMKEAFETARQAGAAGTILSRLFHTAFHTGKRTRTETEIGQGAVSVSYAAAELASKIFDDLSARRALLIGAGETGKLTARHILSKHIGELLLTNRTRERAEKTAAALGGSTVVDFDRMEEALSRVDIVITSVNAPGFILSADQVHGIMKRRANAPLFIIDIGVPRNVDPDSNKIDNVFLHNIDTLNLAVDSALEKRRAEIPHVRRIVREEVLKFCQWYSSLQITPTIQELRDRLESIRLQEMEKAHHRFSPEILESVDSLTKRIVNKILHTPMVNLRDGTNGEGSEETLKRISVIRGLFGLEEKDESRDHEEK